MEAHDDSPRKDAIERYFCDFMAVCFPQAHADIDWIPPRVFLDQELRAVIRDAVLGKRVADKLARDGGRRAKRIRTAGQNNG